MTLSYLQFVDSPTHENVRKVQDMCGLTQAAAAAIAGVSRDTYKGWCAGEGKAKKRLPHSTGWNYFMFQLEARRLGYDDAVDFFQQHSC